MMMNNNAMVQELNDTQLDMVVGGFSFAGFFKKVKGAASTAWDFTKDAAGTLIDFHKIRQSLR